MDWRDAPKYLGRLVIYTDHRNEKHIYRLQARKKYNTGKIFAEHKKRRCSALKVYACEGCRFFKTEEEYNAGRAFAEHLLAMKGLRPVIEFRNGCGVMTVEEIENDY